MPTRAVTPADADQIGRIADCSTPSIRYFTCTASSPVFDGNTDWLKATARTKREGGVKSPGIPSIPEPWPSGSSVTDPSFTGGALLSEKFR